MGECYVHGYMDGEGMNELENGQWDMKDFVIC